MVELNYYEAIIEVLETNSYEICTPVSIGKLYKLRANVKKGTKCYKGMCCALLLRSRKLEAKMQHSPWSFEPEQQMKILQALIEILDELCKWFVEPDTKNIPTSGLMGER